MTLTDYKDIVAILGGFFSLVLVFLALIQYQKAEKQRRAEHFFKLREKYNTDAVFVKIREKIDHQDSPQQGEEAIKLDEQRKFLGFYEEIAIMVNSGLIKQELAFYMFGYYAIQAAEMGDFKSYIEEDREYWGLFIQFAGRMKAIERTLMAKNFDYCKITV